MVSIVIPVYNAEAFIRQTMQSVFDQTYTDWEMILVDDCSTDGSVGVIEEVIAECDGASEEGIGRPLEKVAGGAKIRLIRLTEGGSAAKARNAGIEAAEGRYIAFLDADDVWYPEKLKKELKYFEEISSGDRRESEGAQGSVGATGDTSRADRAGFVFTAYEFGDEDAKPNGKMTKVPERLTFRKALSRTVIFTSTVLIDTEVIHKELIYMPQIPSEDTATWWKILKEGYTAYGLNEPLVIYRRPANSLSSNKGVAVKRIWRLYREVAKLNWFQSCWYLLRWSWRAVFRRVVPRR